MKLFSLLIATCICAQIHASQVAVKTKPAKIVNPALNQQLQYLVEARNWEYLSELSKADCNKRIADMFEQQEIPDVNAVGQFRRWTVNGKKFEWKEPLFLRAVAFYTHDIVKIFLDNGVAVNDLTYNDSRTALMLAICAYTEADDQRPLSDFSTLNLLLDAQSIDVNKQLSSPVGGMKMYFQCPLAAAAIHGPRLQRTELIRRLISRGASLENYYDKEGLLRYSFNLICHHPETSAWLIYLGADPFAETVGGYQSLVELARDPKRAHELAGVAQALLGIKALVVQELTPELSPDDTKIVIRDGYPLVLAQLIADYVLPTKLIPPLSPQNIE